MAESIVSSHFPVTLVGAGILEKEDLTTSLKLAPTLVAADGGAAAVFQAGLEPVAVIGDLDSLSADDKARIPSDRLHKISEQNSTDFEKALRSIQAPVILAAGFLGGRWDHSLAAMSALVAYSVKPCILLGSQEIVFHVSGAMTLPVQAGDRVSLFPLARVQGTSEGLKWPIDGLTLSPGGRIGTSNEATGPVTVETSAPGLLAILPRQRLADVMRQFWKC